MSEQTAVKKKHLNPSPKSADFAPLDSFFEVLVCEHGAIMMVSVGVLLLLVCCFAEACTALRLSRSSVSARCTGVLNPIPGIQPNRGVLSISGAIRWTKVASKSLYCSPSSVHAESTSKPEQYATSADSQERTSVKGQQSRQALSQSTVKRPKTEVGSKIKDIAQRRFTGPPCEPSNAYLKLDYNYLSTSSIFTIRHQWKNDEASRHRQSNSAASKGRLGDEFLAKWWQAATKWGLLSGKLKAYHDELRKADDTATTLASQEEISIEDFTLAGVEESQCSILPAEVISTTEREETLQVSGAESIQTEELLETATNNQDEPATEPQQLLNDIWAGRISQVLSRHIAQLKHSLESIATSSKSHHAESVTTYFQNLSANSQVNLNLIKDKTKLENEPLYNSKMSRKAKYNATSSGKGFGSARRDNIPDVSALMGKMIEKNEKHASEQRKQQMKNAQNARKAEAVPPAAHTKSVGSTSTDVHSVAVHSVTSGISDGNDTSASAAGHDTKRLPSSTPGPPQVAAATVPVPVPVPLELLHETCRTHSARVICIGDVHGCVLEVCDLLRAVGYLPGDQVVFLGDLVAKGPESLAVIRLAMDIGALSVRGNHDHEVVRQRAKFLHRHTAVARKKQERASSSTASTASVSSSPQGTSTAATADAAAQDSVHSGTTLTSRATTEAASPPGEATATDYFDTFSSDGNKRFAETLAQFSVSLDSKTIKAMSPHLRIGLSLAPDEVSWLSNLPYFVRSLDLGAVFVHAGLMSGVKLQQQEPWVMMTMRSQLGAGRATSRSLSAHPWAKRWAGPLTVYFGHDTARGLQQYSSAYGIDTGCVYGGNLTAVLLPEQKVVSVPARKAYLKFKKSLDY